MLITIVCTYRALVSKQYNISNRANKTETVCLTNQYISNRANKTETACLTNQYNILNRANKMETSCLTNQIIESTTSNANKINLIFVTLILLKKSTCILIPTYMYV
uniref:Uncharacterized protein n=1 Tax=Cacopsylla melanoneura TaxID=428564 RepID=A0A8D9B285_9HEMI